MDLKYTYEEYKERLQAYASDIIDKERAVSENLEALREELRSIDKGDASENAPLQICKDKIAAASTLLHNLSNQHQAVDKTINENYVPNGRIKLGSIVNLELLDAHEPETDFTFKIVVPELADFANMRTLATNSIVGRAIINLKAGDTVTVVSQSSKYTYSVKEVY